MPEHYQIRVGGHLDREWSAWFDGLTLAHDPDGCTTLAGPVTDQAALYGLIGKARDLGLTLILVRRIEPPEAARCLAAQLPNEAYRELPGVGHNLPVETGRR